MRTCESDCFTSLRAHGTIASRCWCARGDDAARLLPVLHRGFGERAQVAGGGVAREESLGYEESLERDDVSSLCSAGERTRERGAIHWCCGESEHRRKQEDEYGRTGGECFHHGRYSSVARTFTQRERIGYIGTFHNERTNTTSPVRPPISA